MYRFAPVLSFLALAFFMPFMASAQATTTPDTSHCVTLTVNMGIGATDATTAGQVTLLQQYLQSKTWLNANEKFAFGTFGSTTLRAVMRLQKNDGIIATGYVGPLTRADIQTRTCAIGNFGTTPPAPVVSASTTLLTFTSPIYGSLLVRGEKDITPSWTLASGITTLFPTTNTFVVLNVISADGASVGTVGSGLKIGARNENKVQGQFMRTLQGRPRDNNDIPVGIYRLHAGLEYRPTTVLCSATVTRGCVTAYSETDQALIAKAAAYGSDSQWFSVVDPAPEAKIRFYASTTTLAVSQPITLTWSVTPASATCTLSALVAGTVTNITTATGTQVVTPTAAETYRMTCDLTSAWPFPGSTYTTEVKKDVKVGYTTSLVCASDETALFGRCVSTASLSTTYYCPDGTSHPIVAGVANDCSLTVSSTSTPAITSITPSSGPVGSTFTISGSGFATTGNEVYFGYTPTASSWGSFGSFASSNGTSITVTVPASTTCPVYRNGDVECALPQSFPAGMYTVVVNSSPRVMVNSRSVPDTSHLSNSATFTVIATSATTTTIAAITDEELARGWYYGNANQKKPGTPSTWILIGTGRSAMWKAPTDTQSTLEEPGFTASCRASRDTFQITLRWNKVTGATNYPVRLRGPSFATNAVQFNGQSVVGFNNPSVTDNPPVPTGPSYTFKGLTKAGDYDYWGHAWAPNPTDPAGTWSPHTTKTVTCQTGAIASTTSVLGASTSSMCVDLGANLHRGSESNDVTMLQRFLADEGYLGSDPTGFYGDLTNSAVRAYQASRGLPQTGMVYGFTRAAIKADTCN